MRLVDFQILSASVRLSPKDSKRANEAFFPVFEAVRLWLKDQKLDAPFRKIVISLADQAAANDWHDYVAVAVGVCEVTEAVDSEQLLTSMEDSEWVVSIVLKGLSHIAAAVDWESPELAERVRSIAGARPPCVHRFQRLRKTSGGTDCDVWLEADVGHTEVKVRFARPAGAISETSVAVKSGPLYLEDEFPVAKTAISDGIFVLLTRQNIELARVPIPT